jgi:hypothetical protein
MPSVIRAMLLPSFFAGGDITGPPDALKEQWLTAKRWQLRGSFWDVEESRATHRGIEPDRMTELVGRMAAAGEELGLACTASLEARRWADRRPGDDMLPMAARAMTDMSTHYALLVGHGLMNVTVRTVHLRNKQVYGGASYPYWKAARAVPFDRTRGSWPAITPSNAAELVKDALATGVPELEELARLVRALSVEPSWRASVERRNTEFHRLRPQSIDGGVPQRAPWEKHEGHIEMHFGDPRNPFTPDTSELMKEADAALAALAGTMATWLDTWDRALAALQVKEWPSN